MQRIAGLTDEPIRAMTTVEHISDSFIYHQVIDYAPIDESEEKRILFNQDFRISKQKLDGNCKDAFVARMPLNDITNSIYKESAKSRQYSNN
uniref:Uncharacterized protein n=1 Tax=Physcomitrium patens TaxID=3218 RepID=A0A2K1IWA1_PHYPA|nr:hypothetical protein PHYPA_025499 [Physcomitrium patens]